MASADGATLVLDDGRRVLDGLSSWWTSLWGHGHPAIAAAIARQARTLDHVQFGGATHRPAVDLAERLVALAPPGLARVFYSDDGSTAVEVALKVALAWHARRGAPTARGFVALEHAYHGDTVGAMSVSADGPFVADFRGLRFDVTRVPPPVRGADVAACVEALRATLAREGDRVAAVIVEPLLLGAAGMLVYDAAYLRAVADLARRHGALLVADEVFTGFGRTGARFACERAGVAPDVLCVSKALTGGALPLAATLVTAEVFDAFRSTRTADAFLHGHSFTANPIACAAALAALDLLDDAALARARAIGDRLGAGLASLAGDRRVRDIRGLGLVRAVEVDAGPGGYLAEAGRRMADAALEAERLPAPARRRRLRGAAALRHRRRGGSHRRRDARGRRRGLTAFTHGDEVPAASATSTRVATSTTSHVGRRGTAAGARAAGPRAARAATGAVGVRGAVAAGRRRGGRDRVRQRGALLRGLRPSATRRTIAGAHTWRYRTSGPWRRELPTGTDVAVRRDREERAAT